MRVLAWFFLFVVAVLSLIPGAVQIRTPLPSAMEHAAAYLVLAGVFALAYRTVRQRMVIVLLLTGSAGGLELLQAFHPSRYAGFGDFAASAVGALAGVVLASIIDGWITARISWRAPASSEHLP